MSTKDAVIQNIKRIAEEKGISQQEMSNRTGFSTVYISNLLRGVKGEGLKVKTVEDFAKALDTTVLSLMSVHDLSKANQDFQPQVPTPVPHVHWGEAPPDDLSTDDYVFIPLYESRAAATPAVMEVGTDEVEGWACIHASRLGVAGSSQLRAFRVRGDSMKPEILDGDMVAIQYYDVGPDHLEPSAIYAIRIEDNGDVGISLKHVTQHDEHTLLIESVNQEREETGARKFPSRIIDTRDYSYNPIAGRVVWMWREY